VTEEEFIKIFNSCSEMVADQYYPKGEPGSRRSEYLRDQGVLAALLAEAFTHEGIIATLTDITAGSPIEVLRPHLTGHAFGAIRQCHIRGEGTLRPQTVGEVADIYCDGKLGEVMNLGPGRTREILTLLARTGLIDPPAYPA
jgi:hypothetical protein